MRVKAKKMEGTPHKTYEQEKIRDLRTRTWHDGVLVGDA